MRGNESGSPADLIQHHDPDPVPALSWKKTACQLWAYRDDSLAEAEGPTAAKLAFMLRLIVAEGILPQHHPPVLPAMNVVGPL